MAPEIELSPLRRADGSAHYSYNGYAVLAAVNGPIEVQRRDELPEEASVEVAIRPSAGVGGVRERHFESILQKTLRHAVKVTAHPRTLIQVTLQVVASPEDDSSSGRPAQAASNLQILPHLINAAFLGLLSTSIPLETVVISTLVAAQPSGTVTPNPSLQEIEAATSLHALAYSTQGQLVVVESEGRFDMDTWEAAAQMASKLCLNRTGKESDPMETQESLEAVVRRALEEKISEEEDEEEDDEGEEIGD